MMKRILIIDDNEDIRKIIGYDLIKAGFDVDDAQDGESGYQMIQKEKNYDLIIVDWMMPWSPEKDVTYVRGFLGRMLFSGDDGLKRVNVLSGGERVRCMLSRMMMSGANTMILDEPTNHLDMESITALNNGLIKYPGVLLFTSQDHQFVQTTANRIMEITPGGLIDKQCTYDEYLENDELARKRQVMNMDEQIEDENEE